MSNQSNSQYFNLTADGVGFVNRIRKVQSKKGDPYLRLHHPNFIW